jgi:hypothetical protein
MASTKEESHQYRIIRSDGTETIETTDSKLDLETMQKIVGGHIDTLILDKDTVMVILEDCINMKIPGNAKASQICGRAGIMPIRGDVIIARDNLIDWMFCI